MGWFWSASHSQIYPELRRLEDQLLITSREENSSGKVKRIYELTPAGRQELEEWLTTEHDYPPLRDAERIRLILLDDAPFDVIRRHLRRHLEHNERLLATWRQTLAEIRTGTSPRLQKRLAGRPESTHELVTALKLLSVEGNAARARLEIVWAEDALDLIDALEARARAHEQSKGAS